MSKGRRRGFVALLAVIATGVAAVVASGATQPSATAGKTLVSPPTALACNGNVNAQVSVTGHAGTTGSATDVELVLDLSGSTSDVFANIKTAATAAVIALDAADGATNGSIANNRVGLITYQDTSATIRQSLTTSATDMVTAINGLPSPSGNSPHDQGIGTASAQLALPSPNAAKAIVLITDGQTNGTIGQSAADAAAAAAKPNDRIVTIGVGSPDVTNLQNWATASSYYQPAPIDTTKLIADLGAAVAVPASFSLTETLGTNFAASSPVATTGTVTPVGNTLVWTGTLNEGQTATLNYQATRNGTNLLSVTNEVVSTTALSVTGGTATLTTPAAASIDVLPCGTSLLDKETCTGSACNANGANGGIQYNLNAGTPPSGTTVFALGLSATPPPGACPGFDSNTKGVQFDIRPLTTAGQFQVVIPKAALGSKKWWQTDVCVGTNMKFTTAIGSLANLRPGATPSGGRYWGLLPSLPRLTFTSGVGWVWGPWITRRSQDASGNAVINFTMPYVAGSAGVTTDGKAAFDPMCYGG